MPRRLFFFFKLADGFKGASGLFPAVEFLQRLGEVEMGLNEIGAELSGLLEGGDRLYGPALFEQPLAEEGVGGRKTGVAGERLAEVGLNAGEILGFFSGGEKVPRAVIAGGGLTEAIGELGKFRKAAALQQNSSQRIKGKGVGEATGEVGFGIVPTLQLLEGETAAEAYQQGARQDLASFGEDVESGLWRVVRQEDASELDVGGFRTGVKGKGLFGVFDGGGRVAEAVEDLGGEEVPARASGGKLRELRLRVGVAALGDELLDGGPIDEGEQQDQEHRLYFSTAMQRVLLLTMLAAGAWGAPGHGGSAACKSCHAEISGRQEASHHAGALRRMAATDWPERLTETDLRERSGIGYRYARVREGLRVTITQGPRTLEALLEWAFGSGAQAMTPVGRYQGAYFEHRISYYRATDHPGRTTGHAGTPAKDPLAALGVKQDAATIGRCFGCHATNVGPGPELLDMEPGVRCERCHGPGQAHVAGPAMQNIRRTKGMELCAECHRQQEGSGATPEVRDPASVRFQPVGLAVSRCFTKSGTMTCVTCHDPHENARRNAEHYNKVCQGCHPMAMAPASGACGRGRGENCLGCHMRVTSPMTNLRFTDHRIRVY